MISITITADAAATNAFLVRVEGELRKPKALNDRLGRRLAKELQAHFNSRKAEPNKLGGKKTGFWAGVRAATVLTEVSDTGATVTIGADSHFRIHLLGGTIRPTGGRKFLTIPLVKEARGQRASEYERTSGRKLFRLKGGRVLMERTETGDRSLISRQAPTMRTKSGYKVFQLGAGMRVRAVYALATEATIRRDPKALPPMAELATALQESANQFAARLTAKGGTPS